MYRTEISLTDFQLEQINEWKQLATKYNLTVSELRELVYHIDKIQQLLKKKEEKE